MPNLLRLHAYILLRQEVFKRAFCIGEPQKTENFLNHKLELTGVAAFRRLERGAIVVFPEEASLLTVVCAFVVVVVEVEAVDVCGTDEVDLSWEGFEGAVELG